MQTPSEQSYREIPLTFGQVAIVDAADYEWLMLSKWQAVWDKKKQDYYARKADDGEYKSMHRQILGLKHGDPREGDHWDGKGLHNWRANLRICTRGQNKRNAPKRKDNTSGYKGVDFHKGVYRARINRDGKSIYLGTRSTAKAAHFELYVPAAKEHHQEFARLE